MGDEGLLWSAVSEAVAPIAHLETQWEQDKLEKKLREYFKKAAKNLQFGAKTWDVLINEFADAVFSSIFCGLGDRNWLPQADFLLCVDAAIKDLFPEQLLAGVPQQVFECTVLQATDRAFDEQRYWMLRWETIQRVVTGKGTQKRLRDALDTARADTVQEEPENVEQFVSSWVMHTVALLAAHTQGDPETCLPEGVASQLFYALVQEGGLPWKLASQEEGPPPPDWHGVVNMVRQAYSAHAGGGLVETPNASQNDSQPRIVPTASSRATIIPAPSSHSGSVLGAHGTYESGQMGGKAQGKGGCWGKASPQWSKGWDGWDGWDGWQGWQGWGDSSPQWPEEQGVEEPAAKRWKGGW